MGSGMTEQIREQIAELRIYPGRGGPMGKAADSLESLLAENERLIAGCEMKDKRIDWTVEDNVKKAIEIERLTTENESLRAVYDAVNDAIQDEEEQFHDLTDLTPLWAAVYTAIAAVQKEQT